MMRMVSRHWCGGGSCVEAQLAQPNKKSIHTTPWDRLTCIPAFSSACAVEYSAGLVDQCRRTTVRRELLMLIHIVNDVRFSMSRMRSPFSTIATISISLPAPSDRCSCSESAPATPAHTEKLPRRTQQHEASFVDVARTWTYRQCSSSDGVSICDERVGEVGRLSERLSTSVFLACTVRTLGKDAGMGLPMGTSRYTTSLSVVKDGLAT